MENDLSYFFLVNLSSLTAPINIPSLNKRAEEVSPLLTPSVYLFLLAIIYYFKQSLNMPSEISVFSDFPNLKEKMPKIAKKYQK